jgi:starch synthase
MTPLSPAYDNKIARKYSVKTLEHKVENKLALQKELGWAPEKRMPMLCIPTGMTEELGGKLLKEVLPGLLSQGIALLVLGKGSEEYGAIFTKLAEEKGHRVAIIKDTDEGRRKMYAAADMALFLSNPTGMSELETALQYGTIPVAPSCKALKNYNPVQEAGNSFLYDDNTKWHCFAALVRALETHVFPYDWRTIQRNCMESVGAVLEEDAE